MSIEIKNLSFTYPNGSRILENCSFTLERDRITVLLGRNGSGKSTLGKLICGLHRPDSGQILLNRHPVSCFSSRQRAALLGVVSQTAPPVFDFTAEEIVMMGRHPRLERLNEPGEEDRRKVRQAMADLEVLQFAGRIFNTLSGGEQQRIRLAAALALEPPWLLLDEPTSAQDPAGARLMLDRLAALPWHPGILIISHDLLLSAQYADRAVLLSNRTILADGPADRVLTQANLETVYGCSMTEAGRTAQGRPIFLPAGGEP